MEGPDEMFFEMMSIGEDGADENSRESQTGAVSFDVPASQGDGANASSDATQTGGISVELPTRQEPSSHLRRRRLTLYEATELAITGVTGPDVGWVEAGFTQPLEPSVQIENEAPNDTSERRGTTLEIEAEVWTGIEGEDGETTLEVEVEASTEIEEDEGHAANNGNNNNQEAHRGTTLEVEAEVWTGIEGEDGETTLEVEVEASTEIEEDEGHAANNGNNMYNQEAHLLQLGEQSSSIGNDLFPHLDRLGSHLFFVQLVPEACRLIYHHYRCFLYPALFLALSITLTCVHPQSGDTPDLSAFISYAICLVLSSLAEVGCHRAVVRVYLRKRYGTQMGSSSSDDFFGAALRCVGTALAAMTVMALCSAAYYSCVWFSSVPIGDVRITLLTYRPNLLPITGDFVMHAARGTFHFPNYSILAYLGGALPGNLAAGSLYSHFLVILPTSAPTTVCGVSVPWVTASLRFDMSDTSISGLWSA